MNGFIELVTRINSAVNGVVWGVPALILLIGTGVLMTVLTKGFQFRHFGHMMSETIGGLFRKKDILKSRDKKSISQFQALCTALSATIGTGNIAGIAYAITMGGPGAVFWMWIAAIVGMMTNYSENVLGIFFRRRNEKGEWCGGAMYYLRDGLGGKKHCKVIGKVLAVLFSIFAILASFGIGNMGQVTSIRESVLSIASFTGNARWDALIIGAVVMIAAALVIIGGIQRIARANEKLVPFMAVFYIVGAVAIVCMNIEHVGAAFASIFANAFSLKAVSGGVGGAVIMQAITWGFKRGVFSNEAGQSFSGATKLGLASEAFTNSFGMAGGVFIAIAVTLFAFSTVLGWSYYGTKAWEFLFGTRATIIYKVVFIAIIVAGTTLSTDLVIDLSDTFNGLMSIPNLIGVITLSGTVMAITRNYVNRRLKKNPSAERPMISYFPDVQQEQEKALREEGN